MVLIFTAAVSGFIFSRIKRFQKLMWVAWALTIVGTALLSTLRPNSPLAAQYGYQIISSLGGGIILPARLLSVQASQKQEDIAMATTVVAFMLSLGQEFGIGLGGAIIQNRWDSLVQEALAKHELTPEFSISSDYFETAWNITSNFPVQYKAVYQEITAESIGTLFVFCSVCAGVGFLCSLMAKDLSLDKDARSRQRFITTPKRPETADTEELQLNSDKDAGSRQEYITTPKGSETLDVEELQLKIVRAITRGYSVTVWLSSPEEDLATAEYLTRFPHN